MKQLHYTWLLPLCWTPLSALGYLYPGDEYALYAMGSLPGLWAYFLFRLGDVNSFLFPLHIALGGALVMALGGLALDKLGANRRTFWLAAPVLAAVLLFYSLSSHGSLEEALGKNGSYQAYVLLSVNVAVYLVAALLLAWSLMRRLIVWSTRRRTSRREGEAGG